MFTMTLPAVIAFLGCAPGASSPDTDTDTDTVIDPLCDVAPAVLIGTGEETFEPLAEGDDVSIISGPQGGWHIWEAIETYNLGVVVDSQFTITLASTGAVLSEAKYLISTLDDETLECRHYFYGIFGFLNTDELHFESCDTPPEVLGYREICLSVALEDEFGVTVSDSVCVLAVPWSGDETNIDEVCWPDH